MRNLRILLSIALIGFISLAVYTVANQSNQLKLRTIELKSTSSQLDKLQLEYDNLSVELQTAEEKKNISAAKIKALEAKRKALEAEKAKLQQQLQAKLDEKNRIASAATNVVNAVTNASTASASNGTSVEQIVRTAAKKYGIDQDYAVKIARCESGLNPNAINRNYYDHGNPSGIFQHISGYWPARAAKYGWSGASVFNAKANAEVTMQMWRDGLMHLWECR